MMILPSHFESLCRSRFPLLLAGLLTATIIGCTTNPGAFPGESTAAATSSDDIDWMAVTDEEWKQRLTAEQFRITREHGTEHPFRNEFWDATAEGAYHCAGCDLPLFRSLEKYKSGTGWPSFWQPTDPKNVSETADYSLFVPRTEVSCSRCRAHLGHMFSDGPEPTGLRYCINSASLQFHAGPGEAKPVAVSGDTSVKQLTPFAMVELFTSEGCNSCPPADQVLAELNDRSQPGAPIYCLGFHVDYWDSLGWKDRFGSAKATARQTEYARRFRSNRRYTPQMIVNRTKEFVGSNRRVAQKAITEALASRPSFTIDLKANIDADVVTVDYSASGQPPKTAVMNVALVHRQASSIVERGENAGRTLLHVNPVLAFEQRSLTDVNRLTLPIPDAGNENLRLIVYCQNKITGEILSVADVSL